MLNEVKHLRQRSICSASDAEILRCAQDDKPLVDFGHAVLVTGYQLPATRPRSRTMTVVMQKEMASSTNARANARSNAPVRVSSTIAVVSTRVELWIFPPTSITAPTSAM